MNPLVSVVVPFRNAESVLEPCIRSLRQQTLGEFEVVCVDDGSTDQSRSVLAELTRLDPRFTVLEQAAQGAGQARNRGLDHTSGDYVIFLDADDVFEPDLLESAAQALTRSGADICLFDGTPFAHPTGKLGRPAYLHRSAKQRGEPFSPSDVSTSLFQLTSPSPWLRMTRRDLIVKYGLRFDGTQRSNDLFFTAATLSVASSIIVLDRSLVRHRQQRAASLQSTLNETPFDFVHGLDHLRDFLREQGSYTTFEQTFRRLCASTILHNLGRHTDIATYVALHEAVRTDLAQRYDLTGHRAGDLERWQAAEINHVMATPAEQSLLEATRLRRRVESLEVRLRRRTRELRALKAARRGRVSAARTRVGSAGRSMLGHLRSLSRREGHDAGGAS